MEDLSNARELWLALAGSDRCAAAPVSCFQHVPLAYNFECYVRIGTLVEVPYRVPGSKEDSPAYWIASVLCIKGYFVKLIWIGEENTNKVFWRNCVFYRSPRDGEPDLRIHPLGYARKKHFRLEPPRHLGRIRQDLDDFIQQKTLAKEILHKNFHIIALLENRSAIEKGAVVDTVDVGNMRETKRALVESIIGRRMKLRYLDDPLGLLTFWFHEDSEMFVPTNEDFQRRGQEVSPNLDLWRKQIGSKLEVIDPLRPQQINIGTIEDVLDDQHLIVGIEDNCHRVRLKMTSPVLLPAGFAAENGLQEHFYSKEENFSYENTRTVPRELLQQNIPQRKFEVGQFLEVVALPQSDLIFPGQIKKIAGHILLIGIDTDTDEYKVFVPTTSTDIFPVGWCDLSGYHLCIP